SAASTGSAPSPRASPARRRGGPSATTTGSAAACRSAGARSCGETPRRPPPPRNAPRRRGPRPPGGPPPAPAPPPPRPRRRPALHLPGARGAGLAGQPVDARPHQEVSLRLARRAEQLVDIGLAIADVDAPGRVAEQLRGPPEVLQPADVLLLLDGDARGVHLP